MKNKVYKIIGLCVLVCVCVSLNYWLFLRTDKHACPQLVACNPIVFDITPKKINNKAEEMYFYFDHWNKKDFAVITPKGELIYLVIGGDIGTFNLFTTSEFGDVKNFKIKASDLVGYRFINGKKGKVFIFKEEGVYDFIVSDNLETEFENSSSYASSVVFSERVSYVQKVLDVLL